MAEAAKKNLHIPLPPEVHAALKEQAERLGAPATTLGREAIEEWLARRKRQQLADEIRAYADEMAGTVADVDDALVTAGMGAWLGADE